MKFLDLFSGIGGFRLGLERSGHTPVGYVEIDKFARQSYQAMYNTDGEWTAEDINKVTDEQWRKFNGTVELIAGGFPCQSFSIAGKREGFLNQTKGTLFFEVARAVKQIKPRFVFLENVKGLLNHDKGNTFRTILNTFDELGYDVEWRICNSKDFGVPQNRERVYIIGHLRGDSGREVFPFFGEDGEINQSTIKQIGNVSTGKMLENNSQSGRVYSLDSLSPTISAAMGMGGGRVPLINPVTINVVGNTDKPEQTRHGDRGRAFGTDGLIGTLQASDYKEPKKILINPAKVINPLKGKSDYGWHFEQEVHDENGLCRTVKANGGSGNIPKVILQNPVTIKEVAKINNKRHSSTGNSVLDVSGISGTLTTNHPQNTWSKDYRIRKLTPRECWRLQAFPDELFEKAQQAGLSDSQLYKQAGNSVTVNVIEYIGNLLKERE